MLLAVLPAARGFLDTCRLSRGEAVDGVFRSGSREAARGRLRNEPLGAAPRTSRREAQREGKPTKQPELGRLRLGGVSGDSGGKQGPQTHLKRIGLKTFIGQDFVGLQRR